MGNPEAFHFPRALRTKNSLDFSFSGVKTAMRTCLLQMLGPDNQPIFHSDDFWPQPTTTWWTQRCHDLLASFQAAVVDALVTKTSWAIQQTKARAIAVVGGVACNSALRQALQVAGKAHSVPILFPSPILCTDNAAMIACAAAYRYQMQPHAYENRQLLTLDAHPNLTLANVF
jgi:N6-L-threonylcarbamoyladenine synthase